MFIEVFNCARRALAVVTAKLLILPRVEAKQVAFFTI